MLYEPWIESAVDYNELKSRLIGRGYTDLSTGITPLLDMEGYVKAPVANTSSCQVCKTMLRKKN